MFERARLVSFKRYCLLSSFQCLKPTKSLKTVILNRKMQKGWCHKICHLIYFRSKKARHFLTTFKFAIWSLEKRFFLLFVVSTKNES